MGELVPDEVLDVGQLACLQDIHLGQKQDDVRGVAAESPDELDVVPGQRRIDTHGDQGQPHVREPIQGGLRVVLQNALETRSIDEANLSKTLERRQFHANGLDPLGIAGIPIFGGELRNAVDRDLLGSSVRVTHLRPLARAVLDLSDGRRHGDRPDRQQRSAEKLIQEGALSGLEAAQDGDVQNPLFPERPAACQKIAEGGDPATLADPTDLLEHPACILARLRYLPVFRHPVLLCARVSSGSATMTAPAPSVPR